MAGRGGTLQSTPTLLDMLRTFAVVALLCAPPAAALAQEAPAPAGSREVPVLRVHRGP